MGRLFIAAVPENADKNQELKHLLGKLKRTVAERAQEARWTKPDMWHVTLAFLGEVSPPFEAIRNLFLSLNLGTDEIVLRLQGLGAFPTEESARVLWIGVQENQSFLNLQSHLAHQLTLNGFSLEEREFRPHLTLARFRNLQGLSDLVKLGGRKHFGDYPVHDLILFESVLEGNMTKYIPLARRGLKQESAPLDLNAKG